MITWGPDFMYLLKNPDTELYYREVNGVVTTTATPYPLKYTPQTWRDLTITNVRNSEWFGVDRAVGSPQDFVKDNARILKHIAYRYGTESKLVILIGERRIYVSETEYGTYYVKIYEGEIDLSTFVHAGPIVSANSLEGGMLKYLKANRNVIKEYPISELNPVRVKMTPVRLLQKANFIVLNSSTTGALQNNFEFGRHTLQLDFVSFDAITTMGTRSQERVKTGNTIGDLWNTGEYFLLTGELDTQVTIKWNFRMRPTLAPGTSVPFGTKIILQLHALRSDSDRRLNIALEEIGGGATSLLYGIEHVFSGEHTVTIPSNCRVLLYMTSTGISGDITRFVYNVEPGDVSINYTYGHRTTFVWAVRWLTLYKRIVKDITDQKYEGDSALLEQYKDIVVISGDGLRRIEGAKIKTSLDHCFRAARGVLGAGMGIENKGKLLRLESRDYFANYSTSIDLGSVTALKVSPANEEKFHKIKVGYPEQNYEDVNGRSEFNNTQLRTTPTLSVTKELNLVIDWRADPYGMEFTRINTEGKTTTDDKADNDVFLMHIEDQVRTDVDGEYYLQDRSLNASATGVLDAATIFNLYLSPARNFWRNGSSIHAGFYKQDTGVIKFETTEKNRELKCGGLDEDVDITIASLPTPLFSPWLLEFETRTPINLIELLEQDITQSFTFTYSGVQYKGITWRLSIQPGTRKAQTFTLMSAPDNDLTLLEDVYE